MARRDIVVLPEGFNEKAPNEFYCWGDISDVGIVSKKEQVEKKLQDAFDSITIEEDETTPETDYVLKVLGKDSGARIVIPFDAVIKDAYFNSETKEIVLIVATAEGDKEIKVSVKDLVDTYTGDDVTIKVEGHVISISQEVMDKFDDLKNSIKEEERRADASEKSLKNAIDDEVKRATEAEQDLEKELVEKTKNMVEWQYSSENRKHIVLGNHENMIGTSTDGGTYNLAMVSKWDVADFGSSQLHANLNSKDGQVTINDDKVVAVIDDVNSSEERLQEKIDTKADKEHTHEISDVVNLQSTLDTKLNIEDVQAILKEQIYKLFNIDMIKSEEFVATEMNNPSEKYAVIGNGETIALTSTKSILAEELKMNDIEISSEADNKGLLSISANKVEIEDTNFSGSWNRSVGGNTMVTVNNAQNVSLKDVTVSRTNGYNAVEVGLDGKGTSKTIIIDGLEITEKLSNNGISIFSFEDNADVVIKNCHFTEVSNPIRISNATYAKNVNITVKDCTFDKWESGTPAYAGLVLLQDYTSKTKEEALGKKPFATFTITIDNVTGPYGKIDKASTIEEICGSGIVDKQLVYVYADKAGLIPYDKDTFPTIIIK